MMFPTTCIGVSIRAITLAGAKKFPFYTSKTYFFYFTLSFLQNTHVGLSIIHLYSNKIFIFFTIFYYFLHCLTFPLRPNHHHHHYLDRRTIQDQTNPRSKTHSSRNPLNSKAKSSPTQPKTQ